MCYKNLELLFHLNNELQDLYLGLKITKKQYNTTSFSILNCGEITSSLTSFFYRQRIFIGFYTYLLKYHPRKLSQIHTEDREQLLKLSSQHKYISVFVSIILAIIENNAVNICNELLNGCKWRNAM